MDKHSGNTIPDRIYFLGIEADGWLRLLLFKRSGGILEALVQCIYSAPGEMTNKIHTHLYGNGTEKRCKFYLPFPPF